MSLIPLKKSTTNLERRAGDLFSPLQREMNRFVDEFFSSFPSIITERGLSVSVPAVNISENEKAYAVTAELPGMEEKDVEISVSDNALQIKGEKELSKEEKENGFITMERSYGSFYRTIPFTSKIDENKIKATLKDGVLTIDVPKAPDAVKNTKKISVQKA